MTITIDDASLESRLADLGQQQTVPATKTRLALTVLSAALRACDESGDPEAWLIGLRPTVAARPNESATPASIRADEPTSADPSGPVGQIPVSEAASTLPKATSSPAAPAGESQQNAIA